MARWPATEQLSLLFSPSSLSIVSSPRPRPPKPAATRRKSLRLTGSHGITGTRDIYASAPTDRSITRNKEIANLLQEENPAPPTRSFSFSDSSALPAPCNSPSHPRPTRSLSSSSILSAAESKGVRYESYFGFYGSRPPWVIRQRSR